MTPSHTMMLSTSVCYENLGIVSNEGNLLAISAAAGQTHRSHPGSFGETIAGQEDLRGAATACPF